jgi:hypothetical protein
MLIRRLGLSALFAALGFLGHAWAQTPIPGFGGVKPVGTQQPKVGTAVPKVGNAPPGFSDSKKMQDPFGLQGYGVKPGQLAIDPKDAITPYPQGPAMPDKSVWDKLYDRWLGLFGSDQPKAAANWTPGIGRRNRDRKEMQFRRD